MVGPPSPSLPPEPEATAPLPSAGDLDATVPLTPSAVAQLPPDAQRGFDGEDGSARRMGATASWANRHVPGAFAAPRTGYLCVGSDAVAGVVNFITRKDYQGIDLGAWTRVAPARLIIPLDVHVARVGRCLGLAACASPGWRMAASITACALAPS